MEPEEPTKVYNLKCAECSALLSQRGRKTFLVSDTSSIIYAADFATLNLMESEDLTVFPKCKCQIRNVSCKNCEKSVGYHVLYPCDDCTSDNYLPFFWLFYPDKLKEEINELYNWENIPGVPEPHDIVDPLNIVPDYLFCGICFNLMEEASILKCGHTFCKICITRVIDLSKKCPFDKITVTGEMVFPNFFARDVINDVVIKCGKCQQVLKVGENKNHKISCIGFQN